MGERMRIATRRLCLGVVFSVLFLAGQVLAADRSKEWNQLVDEYLDKVYFPQNPSAATVAGLHQHDAEIEAYSAKDLAEEVAMLHKYEARVDQFSANGLTPIETADREILLGEIRSTLLTLETLRPREKNPDVYSSGAAGTIYVLMVRKFAPPESRLRSVVARERKLPGIFASARENLKNPPRVFTEIALEQMPGIIGFSSRTCR
jgi:hypothetical protein